MNLVTWSQDPLWRWLLASWLAVLLAHGGVSKLLDRHLFLQHVSAYLHASPSLAASLRRGLGARGLDRLIQLIASALPLLELAIGVALVVPASQSLASLAAALLLAWYALWMGAHWWAGHTIDCGCGGDALPVSAWLLARNAVLIALSLALHQIAASLSGPTSTLTESTLRTLNWLDGVTLLAGLLLATLIYGAFHELLKSISRIQRPAA